MRRHDTTPRAKLNILHMDDKDLERFHKYIAIDPDTGCWLWQGYCNHISGYACMSLKGKFQYIHRASYVTYNGKIPDGKEVHHECNTRNCANPAHLRAVTRAENLAQKKYNLRSACRRGHEYNEENTYVYTARDGATRRQCKACRKMQPSVINRTYTKN